MHSASKTNTIQKAYNLFIAVCLFVTPLFFIPVFSNSFTAGKEILLKTLIVLFSLSLLLISWFKKNLGIKSLQKSPLFMSLCAFFLVKWLSDMTSENQLITLYGSFTRGFGLIMSLYYLAITIYTATLLDQNKLKYLLKTIFLSSLILSTYGLLQKAGIDPLLSNFDKSIFVGRISSLLGNPCYLGQYSVLIIPIGVYLYQASSSKKAKAYYMSGILILIATMLLSETRASLLALAVMILFPLIDQRKKIAEKIKQVWDKNKIALIITSLLLIIATTITVHQATGRFAINSDSVRSLQSRLEIWNGTIKLISKKPLLGYGEETFSIHFPEIITKKFLTLEEDINLSADRTHNELLQTTYDHGIVGAAAYLAILITLIWTFFHYKNKEIKLLSIIVIANIFQNQFSFPDTSITLLIYFLIGAIISKEVSEKKAEDYTVQTPTWIKIISTLIIIPAIILLAKQTIYAQILSNSYYYQSQKNYQVNAPKALELHKKALSETPYYSSLWYELMILAPTEQANAINNIQILEGTNSGNLLAWKGNYYTNIDQQKASDYYYQALQLNPYHPNWIRSYADMLYKYGDNEDALFLYRQYLEAVPDYWKWSDNLTNLTEAQQKSYRIFFKNSPDFTTVYKRVQILQQLEQTQQTAPL